MRKHLFYLSMVLVLTLFSACGGGKKGVFTPTSSGRAYEVLVVVGRQPGTRPARSGRFSMCLILMFRGFPSQNVHSESCILPLPIMMPL